MTMDFEICWNALDYVLFYIYIYTKKLGSTVLSPTSIDKHINQENSDPSNSHCNITFISFAFVQNNRTVLQLDSNQCYTANAVVLT